MLKLKPNPTFSADVCIPVPGSADEKINLIFKHKNQEEMKRFQSGLAESDDVTAIMEIVADWEGIDQPFSREAVEQLVNNYHGVGHPIFRAYFAELNKARLGN
jgi:hypothetical protein